MAEKKQKPLLSIGMIFKNEIRCLERCLKSLQPLREAVPCELVMADTGSEDGSREVAAQYADILFDFPWINDFSAARNAVMDKCCGKWYLTIDADEWLEDIDELVNFLRQSNSQIAIGSRRHYELACLISRNYSFYSAALRDDYMDVFVPRMILMSTGLRYSGAIHETWRLPQGSSGIKLSKTILHHDGYAGIILNDKSGQAKRERNMVLLREELAKQPDNLRTLSECLDASVGDERWNYACQLVELVKEKKPGWNVEGAASLGSAVVAALNHNQIDKAAEWIDLAEDMFPRAFIVRLDLEIHAIQISWNRKNFADVVRRGERFLQAYADYHAGRGDKAKNYMLVMSAPRWKPYAQIYLSCAYSNLGEYDMSWKLLQKLEFYHLDKEEIRFLLANLKDLHSFTNYDVVPFVQKLWDTINQPDYARSEECIKGFMEEGARAFLPSNLTKEQGIAAARPAWTLFLPLGEENKLGLAAKLMAEDDLAEMERLLGLVENWDDIINMAPLGRALLAGAKFPVKPMTMEAMDNVAGRLAAAFPQMAAQLAGKTAAGDFAASWPSLMWARGLALAAVAACPWQDEEDLALAQAFADVEQVFLPKYYTMELLCAENIGLLPSMHAFGWYCARAFAALRDGDTPEYVRLLRKGLELSPNMKAMVSFLAEHTPQLQAKPEPSAELLALAEQVRGILAAYPADDPAVAAIKAGPVYQQIAYLLEEPQN